MKKLSLIFLTLGLGGCASLHSTQIGEVDSNAVSRGRKFELMVSETGFNLDEAAAIGKALTNDAKTRREIGTAQLLISLFQMGPKTGNPVLDEKYADDLFHRLKEQCPSGKMSGLMSTRESAKYPVVSGEIVKIVGYCIDG